MSYRPYQEITRRTSRRVQVGRVAVGGGAPITVQTMTNTLTTDVAGTIAQIRDVNLSSRAVRRTGADFDQAQPLQNGLFPAQGRYNLLTICIDRCVRVNRPSQTWSFTALSTATTAASAFAASMKRTPAAGLGWRPHRPRLRNADGVSSAA